MIFNMVGGASNLAGLNFKVVGGTTQPSNPVENTIWVNTSTAITKWSFAYTNPFNTSDNGAVWFSLGADSKAPFNALKENDIHVYPLTAKQCVNGSWVDVAASTYQNGAWSSWIVYLFKANDQCVDLTGGWVSGYDTIGLAPFRGNGGSQSIGETMYISWAFISGTSYHGAAFYTTRNKIDLTSASTIKINCAASGHLNYCYIGVSSHSQKPWSDDSSYWNNCAAKAKLGTGTITLDVSNLSGSYYVMVGGSTEDGDHVTGSVKVTEIRVE